MQKVTKEELSRRTSTVLNRVTGADDIIVTEQGMPRWRISAVDGEDSTLARLEREGRYTPPSATPAPWPNHPGGPTFTGAQLDALTDVDARRPLTAIEVFPTIAPTHSCRH